MNKDTSPKPKKVLSVFSLVMINVIAVDSLRTLPISAEYGFSLVFYYFIAALVFFIPIALIAAELATAWPQTGGLYVWVREAFGRKYGFFTIWLQWIYNVVWYPTILAFIAAAFAYLINPKLANDRYYLMAAVMIVFWCATIVNCFGMRVSSWISTIGAILGTLIPMLLIIALGTVWVITGKPEHIHFTMKEFFPNISNLHNLVLITGVLFGLIGMEMSAVHAEEVKNPQRDYPRALLYSTGIIFTTLILASLAIAVVVPQNKLSLVSGLIDAFSIFFKAYHLNWMIPVIVMLIIIGGISGVSAWVIGPTKGLMIAMRDGNFFPTLAKANRYGAPAAILILQAIVFTLLCSVFLLFPTVNSSYWVLSALTAQLALMVYVMMFAAAIKLRYSHPNTPRAYRIPGNNFMMWLVAGAGILTCLAAIALGFLPPAQIKIHNIYRYEAILWLGIIFLSAPPFIIYRFSGNRMKSNDVAMV